MTQKDRMNTNPRVRVKLAWDGGLKWCTVEYSRMPCSNENVYVPEKPDGHEPPARKEDPKSKHRRAIVMSVHHWPVVNRDDETESAGHCTIEWVD